MLHLVCSAAKFKMGDEPRAGAAPDLAIDNKEQLGFVQWFKGQPQARTAYLMPRRL